MYSPFQCRIASNLVIFTGHVYYCDSMHFNYHNLNILLWNYLADFNKSLPASNHYMKRAPCYYVKYATVDEISLNHLVSFLSQ